MRALVPTDAQAYGDELPRWDYWPTLATGHPFFAGHYLVSKPDGIHLTKQSFEAIDLFALGYKQTAVWECPLRSGLPSVARDRPGRPGCFY